MKLAILALVGILVLGGGAAGAYFYFGKKAEAAVGETAEHTEAGDAKAEAKKDDHGKDKKAKGGHGDGHGGPAVLFVEMDPLILPIIDAEGVNEVVSLVITLEVEDEGGQQAVKDMTPRLKDAYIQDMYGVLNRQSVMKDGVLQIGMIKNRLNRISHEVMGEHVVKSVLLQVVQQRPM